MERVPPPCSGCANAFCYICTRYPGGLNGKPRTLMYFDDKKWVEFPSCIHPTMMNSFLVRESMVHIDGLEHTSNIIDFERMIMVNKKTKDRKHLAWHRPSNSGKESKGSYKSVDLTLKLGVQPNMNEENKMKGKEKIMEDDPDGLESCGSNEDILEANLWADEPNNFVSWVYKSV